MKKLNRVFSHPLLFHIYHIINRLYTLQPAFITLSKIFNTDLFEGVLLQRLLVAKAIEQIQASCHNINIKRDGDDIFINGKKSSVSIAAKTLTSVLIHFAINIISEGAIIEVSSLGDDTTISDYEEFAKKLMISYINEIEDIKLATTKVLGVYNEQ